MNINSYDLCIFVSNLITLKKWLRKNSLYYQYLINYAHSLCTNSLPSCLVQMRTAHKSKYCNNHRISVAYYQSQSCVTPHCYCIVCNNHIMTHYFGNPWQWRYFRERRLKDKSFMLYKHFVRLVPFLYCIWLCYLPKANTVQLMAV